MLLSYKIIFMNKEEFRRRRAAIKAKSDKLYDDIKEHRTEEERIINVLHNAEFILKNSIRHLKKGHRYPRLMFLFLC